MLKGNGYLYLETAVTDLEKARATQLANIEKRTGKGLAELVALLDTSGAVKFGERRDYLKRELGMGHGDANAVVAYAAESSAGTPSAATTGVSAAIDAMYSGKKAHLRPLHDALVAQIDAFGEYEIAPKKGYVSLRRNKQFAMIGPTTQSRVDVGLNMKGVPATARLAVEAPGKMCNYKVALSNPDEVDAELVGWIRRAYDSAG